MLLQFKNDDPLDRLRDDVRAAPAVTAGLFSHIIGAACTRLPALIAAGKAASLARFIAAGAWNDAALALIELELPRWKLRRLVHDDGEWFCSLSEDPALPIELDRTADCPHADLALALLGAFLEAKRRKTATHSAAADPQVGAARAETVVCDNFA
jgi:hypothetical protein